MALTLNQATATLLAENPRFEVDEELINGVATRTWRNAPRSLVEVFSTMAGRDDTTYLVFEDESYTYGEIAEQVALLRGYLASIGVTAGDRVGVAMRNYPEWIVAFWAATTMGAIVVPLNAWWLGAELTYGVVDSGSSVLLLDDERLERLLPHIGEIESALGSLRVISVRSDREVANLDLVTYRDAIATASSLPPMEIEPDTDCAIFYTSGTTGAPKGAILTHRNIVSCMVNAFFSAARKRLVEDEVAAQSKEGGTPRVRTQNAQLLSVPLFHATGTFAILIPNTYTGGKIVMMYRWNPEKALELIERERITSFGGVPAMVWQVLNSPEFESRDTSSVQIIGYGGAPSPSELVRQIGRRFPTSAPSNGYGLTETTAIATINVGESYRRKPDSAGPPLPVVEIRITDDDGQEVPAFTSGEIRVKGPTVIRGYWNKPEATATSFAQGWFRSGDIGYLDDEGFIHVIDRKKDVIIRGGENIYSIEVESAIFEHPDVADVAVIGIPDLVLGEEVGAVVQLKVGATIGVDELRSHVAQRLASFKVPSHIFFRDDELPRNAAGKVLKRQLRDELMENP